MKTCRHRGPVASLSLLLSVLVVPPGAAPGAESDSDTHVPGAPHLLPENTLVYARLDDAVAARQDFAKSSLGKMIEDPRLKPLATDVLALAADFFQQVGSGVGVPWDEVIQVPTGQVAMAVFPGRASERSGELIREQAGNDDSEAAIRRRLELKRQQQNAFSIVFLIEAGENIEDLMSLIERVEERLGQLGYVRDRSTVEDTEITHWLPSRAGSPELEYFVRAQTLVFGVGHRAAQETLERWLGKHQDPTLAEDADFAAVMSRCIGAEATRPQITFFIDAYRLLERVVQRQSMAAFFWPLVEQLGIQKIRGVGGSLFRGGDVFESITHVHVLIDPPRDGLFGLLRPQEVDPSPPAWVPADVSGYTSIHWDFQQAYENLGHVLETFQRGNLLQTMIEEPTQELLGASFQEDLLPNLTGRYASCGWIEPPVRINSQVQVHAVELSDPAAVVSALEAFRQARPEEIRAETIDGTVVYFLPEGRNRRRGAFLRQRSPRAGQDERSGQDDRPGQDEPEPNASPAALAARQQLRESMRQEEPSLVVLGDWAVYSDSRKFVELAIAAERGAAKQLIQVPEYDLILSELGGKVDGEKPFLISFLKGADLVRQMYELAQATDTRRILRTRSQENPTAGRMVELLEQNELPPFEEFASHFAPTGMFAYDEPDGIHIGMFTLKAE